MEPIPPLLTLGSHRKNVWHEEFGDVTFVVFVHLKCPIKPTLTRADRRLRLDHNQRDAVDQQHEVGALLGGARPDGVLGGRHVVVLFEITEVDQAHRDVLAVLSEGHRTLTGEPVRELLVGLDEAVTAHAHQDGPELVKHVVGAVGLGGDFGVQPDQRLAQVVFDQHLVRLARQVLGSEVVPA